MRLALTIALLAAAVAAGGCLGGGGSDKAGGEQAGDAVVLRLANRDSSLDLDEYVDAVERLSDGSIRIELENGWRERQVEYEPRTIEDVRDGRVEMAKINARAFDTVGVDSLQPLVAPFAVDSYALQREVLRSGLATDMLARRGAAGPRRRGAAAGRPAQAVRRGTTRWSAWPTTAGARSDRRRRCCASRAAHLPRPGRDGRAGACQARNVAPFDGAEKKTGSATSRARPTRARAAS